MTVGPVAVSRVTAVQSPRPRTGLPDTFTDAERVASRIEHDAAVVVGLVVGECCPKHNQLHCDVVKVALDNESGDSDPGRIGRRPLDAELSL